VRNISHNVNLAAVVPHRSFAVYDLSSTQDRETSFILADFVDSSSSPIQVILFLIIFLF
jgi:hypothetical protein